MRCLFMLKNVLQVLDFASLQVFVQMSNKTGHVIKIALQDKSDEFCQNIKQKMRLSYKLGPLLQLIRQNMKDATSEARGFTLLSISL